MLEALLAFPGLCSFSIISLQASNPSWEVTDLVEVYLRIASLSRYWRRWDEGTLRRCGEG